VIENEEANSSLSLEEAIVRWVGLDEIKHKFNASDIISCTIVHQQNQSSGSEKNSEISETLNSTGGDIDAEETIDTEPDVIDQRQVAESQTEAHQNHQDQTIDQDVPVEDLKQSVIESNEDKDEELIQAVRVEEKASEENKQESGTKLPDSIVESQDDSEELIIQAVRLEDEPANDVGLIEATQDDTKSISSESSVSSSSSSSSSSESVDTAIEVTEDIKTIENVVESQSQTVTEIKQITKTVIEKETEVTKETTTVVTNEKKGFFQRDWFSGFFSSKARKTEEREDPYPRIILNDLSEKESSEDNGEAQKHSEDNDTQNEVRETEEKVTPEKPLDQVTEQTSEMNKTESNQEENSSEVIQSQPQVEDKEESNESQSKENEASDEQKPDRKKVKRRKSLKLFSCLGKPATKDDEDIIENKPTEQINEKHEERDPNQLAAVAAVLASAATSPEEETESVETAINETSEGVNEVIEDFQQQSSSPLEVVKEETEDALQQSDEILKNSLAKQTPQIALTA